MVEIISSPLLEKTGLVCRMQGQLIEWLSKELRGKGTATSRLQIRGITDGVIPAVKLRDAF